MPQFPSPVNSKLPAVGTTIFTVMSALAAEHGAINLSQGFPDFDASDELISLVNHYMKKGLNQYAPMQGIMRLREAIAGKTSDIYKIQYHPESEITITSGGTEAIYAAITSMIQADDEVIVFEPAYDCYVPAIQLAGGIPVYLSLKSPEFSINWDEVKRVINHKTRMMIINTPQNPAGSVMTASDMKMLESIVSGTDIVIVSDEVYEHIIFDGMKHVSVMLYPGLAERSFVVFSFGKTYHTTGWKIGYCLAPKNLMAEFRKVHQFVVFSTSMPVQHALADYINKRTYLELPSFFQQKRDYFLKLVEPSRFKFRPSGGSYFQNLDYSDITDEKDADFAVRLTSDFGIASIPLSAFYHERTDSKLLRFCFAKKDETLEAAAKKLCSV